MGALTKIFMTLLTFLCLSRSFSQDGFEGIFVEKFYTTNAIDASDPWRTGELEEGAVTYRIYVDLKPGYRFQACYGSPDHPLFIKSSSNFYNHHGNGVTHAEIMPNRVLSKNTVLLDSWLSVGAVSENYLGIPKVLDPDGYDVDLNFEKKYLQNKSHKNDPSLYEKDGMVRCNYTQPTTLYQLDSSLKFLGMANYGNIIETSNGAWACMGRGSVGADSLGSNMVLIAQITTQGNLKFKLNVMIGSPDGTSKHYVADSPTENERTHHSLTYDSTAKGRKRKKSSSHRKEMNLSSVNKSTR